MSTLHGAIRARITARAMEADTVVIFAPTERDVWMRAAGYGIAFRKVFPMIWDDLGGCCNRLNKVRFSERTLFLGEWGCEDVLRERYPDCFVNRPHDSELYREFGATP